MVMQSLLEQTADAVLKRVDTAPLAGKTVLLTGATGLIGSNLAATLHKAGARVPELHRDQKPGGRHDFIIHAAGYAQPAKFMADPMATIRVNTTMLADLLGILAPEGRLLFLSTSEVYSGNQRSLHREEDIGATNPAHARGCYIESKRCGEAICHAARENGQQAMIARVSSVYGPGVRPKDTRVMSQFIDAALRDGEIQLKDGGAARRVFLYVSDAVEMLLNILIRGEGAVYNVGGPAMGVGRGNHGYGNLNGETPIIELARKIGAIMKVPVKIPGGFGGHSARAIGAGGLPGAPAHVGLDLGRYTREFNKEHWVSLDDGLRHTIEWHRQMAGVKAMVAA
jgi:nucleoside-diphosphate-sugar epimerase